MATPTSALSRAGDPLLFTPGPLTTSLSVKQAMLHDAGSWHFAFNEQVRQLRARLRAIATAGRNPEAFTAIPTQGSGTFGVEAVLSSVLPRDGRLLVLANGAYGERIGLMARRLRLDHRVLRAAEDAAIGAVAVEAELGADPEISHVALVHCETTTGVLNPVDEIGRVVARHGRSFIVDAMSSFGALPIDLESARVDYLVSSANKCLEGVPGFSFVIARTEKLLASEGFARSLSLDLLDQWRHFERSGQFRFTPPTHAVLALSQALDELDQEGGVEARGRRYAANHGALMQGMAALGFRALLAPAIQSPVITAFLYPAHPAFGFEAFYRGLSDRGMIIYPGKLTQRNTFRIGTIGRLFPSDMEQLLGAIQRVLLDLGCPVPVPAPA